MKVLIADKFEESGIESLRQAGCDVTCDPALDGESLEKAIAEKEPDVLVVRSTRVTGAMIDRGRALRLIVRAGSGFDTIDVAAATKRNVRVCNCPGMNSVAVAELTLGLMIALDRRIVDNAQDLRRGVWNKKEYSKARGLKGRTLGILGLGRIGYEVAKRAAAFEMELIYHDVIRREDVEEELGMAKVSFDELLARSDFITVHVPGGGETRHAIGAAELAKMKPTACLINCSRGGVIDEKAVGEAIAAGRIGGAGLDVYEIEPTATDKEFKDPVVQFNRVYGTHHIGASTDQAQAAVAEEAVRIIRQFRDSGKILNCVNPVEAAPA